MFIVIEGIDGAGKTTQVALLAERLRQLHPEVVVAQEPGGTALGDGLRELLKHATDLTITPRAELLLFAASRAQLVEQALRPALHRGVPVICDRYVYSTVAYQGYGRGLDLEMVAACVELASGGLMPDVVLLLDLDAEVALERKYRPLALALGANTDRFEGEALAFHQRVRAGYLKQATADPRRWLVLDATLPREELARRIWERVARGLRPPGPLRP